MRHNAATLLRKQHGVELARIILGHSTAFTTEIYAEADRQQAVAVIERIDYTSVSLEETEQSGGADRATNERIIAELNREEPHHLDEDFTYKRPHGFILAGQGTTGITTWQRLFELVLKRLWDSDPIPGRTDRLTRRHVQQSSLRRRAVADAPRRDPGCRAIGDRIVIDRFTCP